MKNPFKKIVIDGDMRPWGWAIGSWDWMNGVAFAYPIPIALMARFVNRIRQRILYFNPTELEKELDEAYNSGYAQGMNDAHRKMDELCEDLYGQL